MRAVRSGLPGTGLVVLMWATPAAAQEGGMVVLEEAANRYEQVSSLCADFSQHLWTPLLRQERTGHGRLCQARPNLFGMRFSEPEGDVFVVDGEWVWYYLPSNDEKQAFRAPAEQTAGGLDFHREFLTEPESKYDVTYEGGEEVRGVPTHRLRLVPKAQTSYEAAVLWVERDAPVLRQIRIIEENGNERTITLTNIDFDAPPPGGWFDFAPPPGVLVMEMPEERR